jgi:crotonobetainyl-CoA:carnitine CoA-transferase CaiB-like acyl-CoA transferase
MSENQATAPFENGFDLLSGVRVLDLTTSIAGPYAAMMLGDMGADVIKVERPGIGDDCRHWIPPENDGESLWFQSVNRNKKSITIGYNTSEGYDLLSGLIEQSHVVIVNQLPRVQKKLKVDFDSLKRINPGIIFVSLTGFGLDGERSEHACYDLIAEGYSGIMDLTGEPDSPAQKVGTPAADMLAGMDAAYAVACAVFANLKGAPRARQIDISLVESMTRFLTPRIVPFMGGGELPRRSGGRDSVIAIYQVFDTQDDPLTLGLGNDNIWSRFWQSVDRPEFGDTERWQSNQERRQCRAEIVELIQEVLRTKPREHWLQKFAEARVPAGPINRIDQLIEDKELQR